MRFLALFLALLVSVAHAAEAPAAVRIDPRRAVQDITQSLTPVLTPRATDDQGHIAPPEPRTLALDDAFSGWSAFSLENASPAPLTRILVFSHPALARSGTFGAAFAHPRVAQSRAVEGELPAEAVIAHANNRYATLRVTLPPNSARTFAFLTTDGARATNVSVWDPQALSQFDSFLLITIGLYWGILFVGAAFMFALRLLAGGPGLTTGGAFALATLAFEAASFSAGSSASAPWFLNLIASGPSRLIALVTVCVLGLAFLRQILMLRDESPIADLMVRVVQYALLIAIPLIFWTIGPPAARAVVAITLVVSGATIWHARRTMPDALQLVPPGWWLIVFAAAAAFAISATGYAGGGPLTEILLHGAFVVGVTVLLFSAAVPATFSRGVLEYTAPQPAPVPAFARDGSDLPEPPAAQLPAKRSAVSEGSYQGLWDWSITDDRLYISPSIERMMGLAEGAIKGKERYWIARIVEEDRKVYVDTFHHYIEQGSSSFAVEFRVHHEDGGIRWLQLRATGLAGEGGRASRIIGIVTDITAAKVAEQKLVHDASHDPLTGIGNRTFIISHLEWAITNRRENPVIDPPTGQALNPVLILLDIDRFKVINSELGRAAGDKLLKQIARSIEQSLGANEFVARIGADEFAILLTPRAGEGNRRPVMKEPGEMTKILAEVFAEPLEFGEQTLTVSAALAYVEIDEHFAQAGEVLAEAERALKRAQHRDEGAVRAPAIAALPAPGQPSRRTAVPITSPAQAALARGLERIGLEATAEEQEKALFEADLRTAIQRDQMSVMFEPIMSLADRTLAGFEASLRWQHPQRGAVPPASFLLAAESTGLIVTLGRFALSMAAMQLSQWQAHFPLRSPLFVSVDMSSPQLLNAEFGRDMSSVLNTLKLAPASLAIEVTESLAYEGQTHIAELLDALRSTGVSIALGDFGEGNSNLARLKALPLSSVVISTDLTDRARANSRANTMLQSMISSAHDSKLAVCARGVDSEAAAQASLKLGCALARGRLFGAPMSAADAQRFIAMNWKAEAPARGKTA
ncbi:MAG: EAL domain-containing protein [Alphaproteobacteria bacterium]